MTRQSRLAALLVALAALAAPARAQDDDAPAGVRPELRYLQGLHDRGYYDLALAYLETLRQAPDTPDDLKQVLDYEEGRTLLEEASHMNDLERRAEGLDKARAKLDAFAKAHPKHELATEAL